MPALLACIAVTGALSSALLMPDDLKAFGKSILATLLFASNIYFWRGSGYFETAAEEKPLLHTWSLAVEEQYYLVFPLILMLTLRWGRSGQRKIVAALAIASFALAVLGISLNKQLPTFFLFPPRAWELLIGSLLALGAAPIVRHRAVRSTIAISGLLAIAASIFLYSPSTPFPGLSALPPCLGAAALIWAGRDGDHIATRLLSSSPVVGLGLISYSLYLWHWPVLVLAKYYLLRELAPLEVVAAVLTAMALAYISWRYVEKPFRSRQLSYRKVLLGTGGGAAAVAALGATLIALNGLPARFSPEVARLNAASGTMYKCSLTDYLPFGRYYACPVHLPSRDPAKATVVLWGDSHAQMYVPAVEQALAQSNQQGLLVPNNGCPPLADGGVNEACRSINAANFARILGGRASTVIIAMNYDTYRDRPIVTSGGSLPNSDFSTLSEQIVSTVERLRAGGKRVIIVAPIPTPRYNLPSTAARARAYGLSPPSLSETTATFAQRLSPIERMLVRLKTTGAEVLDVSDALCSAARCDYVDQSGAPRFADNNHLTRAFSKSLTPRFAAALSTAPAITGQR